MTTITINEIVYYIHPTYKLYAASKDGNVIHIIEREPFKGNNVYTGNLHLCVRKYFESNALGQFVWECIYRAIPEGMVVSHKNNNKEDNRLCNLQLISCEDKFKDDSEDESENEFENEFGNEFKNESEKWRNHLQYKKNKQECELRIIKSEIKRLKREKFITLFEIQTDVPGFGLGSYILYFFSIRFYFQRWLKE